MCQASLTQGTPIRRQISEHDIIAWITREFVRAGAVGLAAWLQQVPRSPSGIERARAVLSEAWWKRAHTALLGPFQIISILLLVLFTLLSAGCDERTSTRALGACITIGVCAKPLPPAMTVDFVVHARRDSTTNAAFIAEDYAATLDAATQGSLVRVWVIPERVEEVAIIHSVEVPVFRGRSDSQRRTERLRFTAVERARLTALVAPLYTRPRPVHAPVFEGLARVAMADGLARRRLLVLVTDGREQSSELSVDFDAASRLPTIPQMNTILRMRRVLEPGVLTGATIYIVRVGPLTTQRLRTTRSVSRELHVHEIWRSALQQAGAAHVEVVGEGLHINNRSHEQGAEQ